MLLQIKHLKKLLLFLLLAFPLATFSQEEYSLSLFEEFTGEGAEDFAGTSVASAGDVNNDGYNDILVVVYGAESYTGAAYLTYGQEEPLEGASLSNADAEFTGEAVGDRVAKAYSAGDVNNDGYDDILISTTHNDDAGLNAGAGYLIYGKSAKYNGITSLGSLGINGAQFTGEAAGDYASTSISSAGDMNGDGYDDILITAPYKNSHTGVIYLIYGQATLYSGTISLSAADAEFTGEAADDYAGLSVSSAGDVNNDGFDDFLIAAPYKDSTGATYLIYGQNTSYAGTINLSTADAKFTGEAAGDSAGVSVSTAGDVNNDGYDDILIGAWGNGDGGSYAGAVYLVYGDSDGDLNHDSQPDNADSISLSDASVEFTGEQEFDQAGTSVSSAGDINNDGYDDFFIVAPYNTAIHEDSGAIYFIYGQATLYSGTISLAVADTKFTGEAAFDWAYNASSAGDVNSDGYDDVLIGAMDNDDAGSSAGAIYLGYLYMDNDHDGLLGPSILSTGTDTNDNDHDNDGIETDMDCNDDDINVLGKVNYYQDLDNDSLGNNEVDLLSCTVITGYVTNNTDLNDNDHDNDGVNTLNDCNDDDNTISEEETYYQDKDNDNKGNPDKTIDVCSYLAPAGYVANDYEKYNEDVSYALGTKKGRGIVKLYDINNVLL
ncbi:MAG: integrin alpha, partial [Patescibacteria group bacterium]